MNYQEILNASKIINLDNEGKEKRKNKSEKKGLFFAIKKFFPIFE